MEVRFGVGVYGRRAVTAVSTPTCCLLSALQALQIATSSVARAAWCGSGVVVDGMTEWSGAEVVDSLVWIAACGYGKRAVTAVNTPTCCLVAATIKGPCVSSALQALADRDQLCS